MNQVKNVTSMEQAEKIADIIGGTLIAYDATNKIANIIGGDLSKLKA